MTTISSTCNSSALVVPSADKCVYLFPTRKASDHHNALCLMQLKTECKVFEPKRVVLSLNGDWCEPVSSFATLNLAKQRHHFQCG